MRTLILLVLGVGWLHISDAVAQQESATERLFEEVMTLARNQELHQQPLGTIMREVGTILIGKPYAEGLLDRSETETLVVDLTRFDCVLYVEAVLALARGIALQQYGYERFTNHLEELRYRDGSRDGYCSRLHYFSEWIANNEKRGIVRNITRDIGGEPLEKRLSFMSEHRQSYARLVASDSLFRGIQEMEHSLSGMAIFHVPQEAIASVYDALQDGDILAMSTHIEGLDVSHTGLAFAQEDGTFGLLHASTSGGVKVSPDLQRFVENNKIQIGLVVARPVDPR